jgi:beta-glucosidase
MKKPKLLLVGIALTLCLSISGCNSASESKPVSESNEVHLPAGVNFLQFPGDFKWGSATASFQVEGGRYDETGAPLRSDTYWDLINTYGTGTNANIAIDQYHRFHEDIALMAKAGMKTYRFSLSMPRLFLNNNGFPVKGTMDARGMFTPDLDENGKMIPATPNPVGVTYYNDLIDELLANGIEPAVTLFHWDFPLGMVMAGEFMNRAITDQYQVYAQTAFKMFGNKVKIWTTLNEPFSYNVLNNGMTQALQNEGVGQYSIAKYVGLEEAVGVRLTGIHNYILAHAKAVHVFNEMRANGQLPSDAQIGMTFDLAVAKSASNHNEDLKATNTYNDIKNGLFVYPVFKGKYPDGLLDKLKSVNATYKINVSDSQLSADLEFMKKNPGDFVALNYYSRPVVSHISSPTAKNPVTFWTLQRGIMDSGVLFDDIWVDKQPNPFGGNNGPYDPQGFYDTIKWLSDASNNIPMYITENGTGYNAANINEDKIAADGGVHDPLRTAYLKGHFKAMWKAIHDGVNLKGYMVWSLFDNLEWTSFDKRFGLIYIDYNDNLKRTPKDSYYYYNSVIKNNGLSAN